MLCNKNICGVLKNRLCGLACYRKSVIAAWKYLKNEAYSHFSWLDLILIWAHTEALKFAILGENGRKCSQKSKSDRFAVPIASSNEYQIESTKMWVYFIFQVLSCCNDWFSIACQPTKSVFQNTTNIFIAQHWSRYGMDFSMQKSLAPLNVHATILFEGIRPWNDVKPWLGIYLERHCRLAFTVP
jgi:hypothetical protein